MSTMSSLILGVIPGMTGEQFLHLYRGGAIGHLNFEAAPARGDSANILGLAYLWEGALKKECLNFLVTELIPEVDSRTRIYLDFEVLKALSPDQSVTLSFLTPELRSDLLSDSIESPLGCYLTRFKDTGFRGRSFDAGTDLYPIFSPVMWGNKFAIGRVLLKFSIAGIEFSPSLPDANFYTYVTHLAALLNCPKLLEALADFPADYLRQDQAKFREILDGPTALHYAAYGLSKDALMYLLRNRGLDLMTLDKNGNTLLHALACSKNTGELAARQLDLLKAIVEFFFESERDLEKRAKFFQHPNKFGDTALNVAANMSNKELVTELVFVPGAKTEGKTETNPKGIDFAALGLDYGTLLSQRHAASEESAHISEERVLSLCAERDSDRAAMRLMAIELNEARERLACSEHNQLLLMQTMRALCGELGLSRLMPPEVRAEFAVPFLALRDQAGAGAGAGAGMGVEEGDEPI